jgi:hypothetical protein
MKQQVSVAGLIVLVAVLCLWMAGAGRGDPQAGPAPANPPAAGKPFLEVGKIYTFDFAGPQASVTAEVVEGPRENFVKVTGKGQGRDGATLWVNLAQVRVVQLIEPK